MGLIPVCLNSDTAPEIVWADRIDPARARIVSVPTAGSGYHYRDLILIDAEVSGYRVMQGQRHKVYNQLQVLRRSRYQTWTVRLSAVSVSDVNVLDGLCLGEELGFDNWSNMVSSTVRKNANQLPEYYNEGLELDQTSDEVIVSIAAMEEEAVLNILSEWEVITLKGWSDLRLESAS